VRGTPPEIQVVFCRRRHQPTSPPLAKLPPLEKNYGHSYASQFSNPVNRAHLGKSRIKARLIANLDPDEWGLPPKPKWMRWSTYNRYVERYDRYQAMLDYGCAALVAKLGKYPS
jgi:hypothetical protein